MIRGRRERGKWREKRGGPADGPSSSKDELTVELTLSAKVVAWISVVFRRLVARSQRNIRSYIIICTSAFC